MSDSRFDKFASVILDQGLDHPLDYGITSPLIERAAVGVRVLVPVRKRSCKGTIIALKNTPSFSPVQPITKLLSEDALISPSLFTLAQWMSRYYCCSSRKALKVLLPASVRKDVKAKEQLFVKRLLSLQKLKELCATHRAHFPVQIKVLDILLKKPKGILLSELLEQAGVSRSPVDTLAKQKIICLETIAIDRSPLEAFEFFQSAPKELNQEQACALEKIEQDLAAKTFQTHLIHGVTGSGKTEIYLQGIKRARQNKQGVILLVPEIALTFQTIERLKSRFTEKLGILHYRLSDGERFDMWHQIQKGKISIVVGARSAIFSPVQNLGLIIVDEEHEPSYKQNEEEPCYHARDVAIMRGKLSNAVVVLGSATPSLESYLKAQEGKYRFSPLTKRASNAPLPEVKVVDMQEEYEKSGGFTLFSEALLTGIKTRYMRGEQTLLFLNRRGYHTFQLCTQCGNAVKCPHCDLSLTFHKNHNHLTCHLCQYTLAPPPTKCPHCRHTTTLQYKGVGTDLVAHALHAILPSIRTVRMDADTTRHKGSHDRLFKQFRSGKGDVLIGTQMIAKGLHFPSVTLVAILNSDPALNIPDFRASETLFQLLTQVAGRSGRGALKGEVIIQTRLKNHPIFPLISQENYLGFFKREIATRKEFSFPPFNRLVKLTFSGLDEQKTVQFAQSFRQKLLNVLPPSFTIYPVIPSGYAKIKDRYRFRLLIQGEKIYSLTSKLAALRRTSPPPSSVRLLIDVDPTSVFQ